ncbi:hypothetical protein CAL26_04475 [Bordetella genomosp. 9]|uniref:Uncharacterized protein n=1 Tax=Bordetella genomosp. 9 TaxID=1416803 RepID=A0A261RQL8_9BORD|nr:hypothetical protein [Bordetella genomosp. 9]OZI26583.1 hypothetical protein CAL26_04475 [Bordetella genomosp. 9]
MAISVTTWLAGDVIPLTATKLLLGVATDGPGSVAFAQTGTVTLTGFPTGRINIEQGPAGDYYATVTGVGVPVGTSDGETVDITVTPYDTTGAPGTPFPQTLTCKEYSTDSGTKTITNGNFVLTPADENTNGKYWLVSMEARAIGGATPSPLAGAMVRFIPRVTRDLRFWTDTTPAADAATLQHANGYFVKTDINGVAALRVTTLGGTLNQQASFDVVMTGIEENKRADGYLANGNDDADEDGLWIPPSAGVDNSGNIEIPEYGQTFSLDVSVNGETGQGTQNFVRYVVMNNTAVFPYDQDNDGVLPIDYSILNQSNAPNSNFFTYVRISDANTKCSGPWNCGVDGTRVNLPNPDPQDGQRVAPALRVIPDPGLDRTIGISTLKYYNGLRLELNNFSTSLLPGYSTGALSIVFNCYMNGYDQDGNDRPPMVYNSVRDAALYDLVPTISDVGGVITFSDLYVELSKGAASNWGRNPFDGGDKKKVGFEYIITQGANTWYSVYSSTNSWYFISTGNW